MGFIFSVVCGDVFATDCLCSRLAVQQVRGDAAQAPTACRAPVNKPQREQRWPSCTCIPTLQEDVALGAGICCPASWDAAASLAHGPCPEHRAAGRGSQECVSCSALLGLAVLVVLDGGYARSRSSGHCHCVILLCEFSPYQVQWEAGCAASSL